MATRGRKGRHRRFVREVRPEVYDALFEAQGGVCALCGRPPSEQRALDLDHDHKTMEVRGLLCWSCNKALPDGKTPDWMRRAADYLEGSWDSPRKKSPLRSQ
jgi:hypothetical protein